MVQVKQYASELPLRYKSVATSLEVIKVLLCDHGITSSPTVPTNQEIGYYLINEYKRHGVLNFSSKRTGLPFVWDVGFMTYVWLGLDKEDSFYKGLELVRTYVSLKKEFKYLNRTFQFSTHPRMVEDLRNTVRWSKKVDQQGYPVITPQGVSSVYNGYAGLLDYDEPTTLVYYKHFMKETTGVYGRQWTFMEGATRKREAHVMHLLMSGDLYPTNKVVLPYYQQIVSKNDGRYPVEEVSPFLEGYQKECIEKVLTRGIYELKVVSPFFIGFSKVKRSYPRYLPYVVWDADLNKPLPFENLIEGIGGEFTAFPTEYAKTPFHVRYHDGELRVMYKVGFKSHLYAGKLNLEGYLQRLLPALRDNFVSAPTSVVEVKERNKKRILKTLEELQGEGVSIIV